MAITDPIADYLTRIRNAQQARHRVVSIPNSKLKRKITEILYEQGYILKYTFQGEGRAAEKVGEVVAVHVIPRPHSNVDRVLPLGRQESNKGSNAKNSES